MLPWQLPCNLALKREIVQNSLANVGMATKVCCFPAAQHQMQYGSILHRLTAARSYPNALSPDSLRFHAFPRCLYDRLGDLYSMFDLVYLDLQFLSFTITEASKF